MGISILNKVSQVIMNNTWLYYYILTIYLGHCLLMNRASLPWQAYLPERHALDTVKSGEILNVRLAA
jgi:hypothetical protein